MAMGDAGDEFSEQVLREIMNSLKDAGRWLRGSNGNGHGKVFKACKDARDKVRSAIMGVLTRERALGMSSCGLQAKMKSQGQGHLR